MQAIGSYRRRYSVRYGARDPWLAGWPRAGMYLIWRAIFAAFRPLIFAGLLAGALLFAIGGAADLRPPAPGGGGAERLSSAAAQAHGDVRAWWLLALDRALEPSPGRTPDLVLAEALAPALPRLAGEDDLARQILTETRGGARRLEAALRGAPAWRRDRMLRAALDARLAEGRRARLTPPELIFAPASVNARLLRTRALYGPALEAVETWFSEPGGRTLALTGAPGLAAPRGAALYGDVRDLVIQSCALAGRANRSIAQCRVVFLPKPDADLLLAGLSLSVAGETGQARVGARILKAGVASGLADRGFLFDLVLGSDPELAGEAVLAATTPLMMNAGEIYTRPVYSLDAGRAAAEEYTRAARIDAARRSRVFAHMASIRGDAGALAAVRLAGLVRSETDAARLAAIAAEHGQATLALHAALGGGVLDLEPAAVSPGPTRLSEAARRDLGVAVGLLALALLLLTWVCLAGWRRERGGAPGLFEQADARITRLILGRNS